MAAFLAKKQDINTIPFDIGLENLEGLEAYSSWLIPQALAKINKIKLVKNEVGLYSPSATLVALRASLGSEQEVIYWQNLLAFLVQTPRGKMVLGKLKAIDFPQYSALAPLALSAFKLYRDVKYSEWDWTDPRIGVFVDPMLVKACHVDIPEFTKDELLGFREFASLVKSSGATRTSNQMTTIYNVGYDLFDQLPPLTKIMLLQTWVAAPKLRHNLCILDPNNLDSIPEPLIDTEISQTKSTSGALAW